MVVHDPVSLDEIGKLVSLISTSVSFIYLLLFTYDSFFLVLY